MLLDRERLHSKLHAQPQCRMHRCRGCLPAALLSMLPVTELALVQGLTGTAATLYAAGANAKWLSLMQVASVSGDLRRCLELLRRAAEIADEQVDTLAQSAGSAGAAAPAGGAVQWRCL